MQAGIVGMGVMGRLLAIALTNAGWKVTLFDQHSGDDNCSFAAAGLLTPFSELDKSDQLIFNLGQESISGYWQSIIERLSNPIYLRQLGTIVLHHPSDRAEWQYFSKRIDNQLKNDRFNYNHLTNTTLFQLEPELTKFESAYYFPNEAHIDCQSLMPAIKSYLKSNNVKFLTNTPVLDAVSNSIKTPTAVHSFDMVFDCRGLGAKSVFSDLRSIRGELIWLHAPEVNLQRPIRLLHPRYNLYIVPRPNNIYLVGASEIETNDMESITVRTTLELLTAVYYLHAGFSEARIIKNVTHCRPTLANHLPRIKYSKGYIAVNGLYRHGYLIAPALTQEILRSINTNHQQLKYPEIWES